MLLFPFLLLPLPATGFRVLAKDIGPLTTDEALTLPVCQNTLFSPCCFHFIRLMEHRHQATHILHHPFPPVKERADKNTFLLQRGAVDMCADEAATVLGGAGGELREVALGRVGIRPEDLREREAARPEFPFEVEAVQCVRRPVATLSADDMRTRRRLDARERIELVDARKRRNSPPYFCSSG